MQATYTLTVRVGEYGGGGDSDDAPFWSSGTVASNRSFDVPYSGPALRSATTYSWVVTVTTTGGAQATSAAAVFSTGLRPGDWVAKPIGMRSAGSAEAPWFRRTFSLPSSSLGAGLLYVASLGFCDVFVNGQPASEAVLSPSVSFLPRRILYRVYNVTRLLVEGQNTVG